MFPDSAEETLTLTMGDLQLQLPRTTQPAPSSPPQPQQLYSHKYLSTSSEQVEYIVPRYDFYPSSYDNSFPHGGNLNNERSFSCSSPTSNTSFLSETSFSTHSQSYLRNSNDSGNASDNFGLLTTTSTPFRGNNGNNLSSDFQHRVGGAAFNNGEMHAGGGSFLPSSQANPVLNDSLLSCSSLGSITGVGPGLGQWDSPSKATTSTPNHSQFDFTFPVSESSITGIVGSDGSISSGNGSSNASADSPTRLIAEAQAAGNTPGSFTNQWNSSNVSSLLDNQSPESSSSNSVPTSASVLGHSIWSPSQVSAANNNNNSNTVNGGNSYISTVTNQNGGDSQEWDESLLLDLSKQQLLEFVALLKHELEKSQHNAEIARANQLQGVLLQVQNFIISNFLSEPNESLGSVSTPTTTITSPLLPSPTEIEDRVATFQRDVDVDIKDTTYTWSGHLPPRIHRNPTYSCKVFLGGLPWDITEYTLMQAFEPFGIIKIEWPGKDGVPAKPKGYAYAVFESEKQVKQLLQSCTQDYSHNRTGNYFYKVSSKKFRGKDVQIIPWAISDSNFNRCESSKIDPLKTIFVGALHGMVNAEGLATIMNDLFGGVVYAGIDTDRTRYPIGSARVTFSSVRSYMRAVTAKYVFIKTNRFDKRLQVDPYLEDATCSVCKLQQGPYFCRDKLCFRYFCRTCFHYKHSEGSLNSHTPMMRTTHNKPHQLQQQANQLNNFNGYNNYNNNNNNSNNNNNGGAFFNNNHRHQTSYSYGSAANNHHHHQAPFNYGGGANGNQQQQQQHFNNNYNSTHHGFNNGGGNFRQWNNGNNGGRNSPQINYPGGGGSGPGSVLKRSKFF